MNVQEGKFRARRRSKRIDRWKAKKRDRCEVNLVEAEAVVAEEGVLTSEREKNKRYARREEGERERDG